MKTTLILLLLFTLITPAYGLDMLDIVDDQEVQSEPQIEQVAEQSIWGPEEDAMEEREEDEEIHDRGRPPCLKKDKDLQELIRIERQLAHLWYEHKYVTVELNRLRNIPEEEFGRRTMTKEQWQQHERHLNAVKQSLKNIERDIARLQEKRRQLIARRGCQQANASSSLKSDLALLASALLNDVAAAPLISNFSSPATTGTSGAIITIGSALTKGTSGTTEYKTSTAATTSLAGNLSYTAATENQSKQEQTKEQLRGRLKELGDQIYTKWQELSRLEERLKEAKDQLDDLRNAKHEPHWSHDEIVRFQEEIERKMWSKRKEIEYIYYKIDLVKVDIYELRGQEDMLQRQLNKIS